MMVTLIYHKNFKKLLNFAQKERLLLLHQQSQIFLPTHLITVTNLFFDPKLKRSSERRNLRDLHHLMTSMCVRHG